MGRFDPSSGRGERAGPERAADAGAEEHDGCDRGYLALNSLLTRLLALGVLSFFGI